MSNIHDDRIIPYVKYIQQQSFEFGPREFLRRPDLPFSKDIQQQRFELRPLEFLRRNS